MKLFGPEIESKYMRTTSILSAAKNFQMPDESCIRYFDKLEAERLTKAMKKRKVFTRHSWENDFYISRIRALANTTIIEVLLDGDPNEITDKAEDHTDLLEKVVALSTTVALDRERLHKKLGIGLRPESQIAFIFSTEMRFVKSRSKRRYYSGSLEIDERFIRRYFRLGCHVLFAYCLKQNDLSQRVRRSLEWLFDSRFETKLDSSIVKTAIALETLLIFSETESLGRTLSERVAFIITPSPSIRESISGIIKRFYNARSGVVHGSKKKARQINPQLLEAVDRITLLLLLVIGSNSKTWTSSDKLRLWCDNQRWSEPANDLLIPFPEITVKRAIELCVMKKTQ